MEIIRFIIARNKLLCMLDEFPEPVLEKGKLPPPDRYCKGQEFELGIPDSERERIFFRAQYPPTPQQIEIFRKLLQPLIEAGIFQLLQLDP